MTHGFSTTQAATCNGQSLSRKLPYFVVECVGGGWTLGYVNAAGHEVHLRFVTYVSEEGEEGRARMQKCADLNNDIHKGVGG